MVSLLEICRRAATGLIVAHEGFDIRSPGLDVRRAVAGRGQKATSKEVEIR
jgi:hypothetical protein